MLKPVLPGLPLATPLGAGLERKFFNLRVDPGRQGIHLHVPRKPIQYLSLYPNSSLLKVAAISAPKCIQLAALY